MDYKSHTKTCKEIKCIMARFHISFKTHALLPFMIVRMLGDFLGDFDSQYIMINLGITTILCSLIYVFYSF